MSETFTSLFSRDDREEIAAKNRRVEVEDSNKPENPIQQEGILSDDYLNSKIEEVKDLGPLAVSEANRARDLYKDSIKNLEKMKNPEQTLTPELNKLLSQTATFAKVSFDRNIENIKNNLPGKLEPEIIAPEITPAPTPELAPEPTSKSQEPEIDLEKFKLKSETPAPEITPEPTLPPLTPKALEDFKKEFARKDQGKEKQSEEQEQEKAIDLSHMLGILYSLARRFEIDFEQRVLEGQLEKNPGDEKLKTLYAAYETMKNLGPEYLKERVVSDIQMELDTKKKAIVEKYLKALKDGEGESTSIKKANLTFEEDVNELKAWMDDKIKSL